MRILGIALAGMLLAASAFGYSGSGGVWGQKNGDFTSKNFAGTAAGIQAAVDYVTATGGNVTIWPGTYDFGTTSLTIPDGDIIIQGSGKRETKLTYSGTGDFIVIGADDGAHTGTAQAYDGIASDVYFRDLWIQGPGKTSAARGVVDWENGGNGFRDVTISNFGTGYWGLGADVSEFRNVYYSNNGYGMYLASRSDQNTVDNCYFAENKFAFYAEWVYGFRITNSQFVFSDSADVVIDSRQDPSEGADTRNGSQRSYIAGCWFEPTNASPPPRHLWLGRFGTSSLFLTGLTVTGCLVFSTNGEIFAQVDGFSDLQLIGNGYAGTAFTFVSISSVSGITPYVADLWNHMSSVVTRVAGAGSLTNYTAIGDSTVFRNATEWRGSNGNIRVPTTGDRFEFTGSGANLLNATAGSLRLYAANTQRLEANTNGVAISGALSTTGTTTVGNDTGDSLVVTGSTNLNKGFYAGGQFVNKILRASAALNFDLSAVNCQDLTITVTGAVDGDEVFVGTPNGAQVTDMTVYGWVSANDTVTIRACDQGNAGNPASATFKVIVFK